VEMFARLNGEQRQAAFLQSGKHRVQAALVILCSQRLAVWLPSAKLPEWLVAVEAGLVAAAGVIGKESAL